MYRFGVGTTIGVGFYIYWVVFVIYKYLKPPKARLLEQSQRYTAVKRRCLLTKVAHGIKGLPASDPQDRTFALR